MATRGKGKSLSSAAEKFYGKPKQQTTRKTRKRALNSSYNVSDFIDEQVSLFISHLVHYHDNVFRDV